MEKTAICIESVKEVYARLSPLPAHYQSIIRCITIHASDVPLNGIYFVFEKGELITIDRLDVDRVVRIGSHRKPGRLQKRIRNHYGRLKRYWGNSGGSVFRELVGEALISRNGGDEVAKNNWLSSHFPEDTEELISKYFEEHYTFKCIMVHSDSIRCKMESFLISLFANYSNARPSDKWLGNYSYSHRVRQIGMWNRQDTYSDDYCSYMWEQVLFAFEQTYEFYGV